MQTPVILLAFANDQDDYLQQLNEEQRGIRSQLFDLDNKGQIKVEPLFGATIDDIFNAFVRFKDRVTLFHYAGHANSQSLFLEDQEANTQGLAQLLAEQKNLELVFLNGCSTKEQVDLLLHVGVQGVIATSNPIDDKQASQFAIRFYQFLASGSNLQKAFNEAMAELEAKGKVNNSEQKHRYPKSLLKNITTTEIPWGIYTQEDTTLDWTVPNFNASLFDNPWLSRQNISNKQVNTHIVLPVFNKMHELGHSDIHLKNAKDARKRRDNAEFQKHIQRMKNDIIAEFPYPVASEIRTLFSNELKQKGMARLEQLVAVHLRLSQFLSFVLLSHLWDKKNAKTTFSNQEFDKELKEFYGLNQQNYRSFNYSRLEDALVNIFKDEKIEAFIPELLKGNEEYKEAFNYLENIKEQLANNQIQAQDAAALCDNAEYSLAHLLEHNAFLINYELISVKDIFIKQSRYQRPPFFDHKIDILKGEIITDTDKRSQDYADSYSILLVKTNDENKRIGEWLNLSPFLIDQNAFEQKGMEAKVLMYLFQDKDFYYYEHLGFQQISFQEKVNPEIKYPKEFTVTTNKQQTEMEDWGFEEENLLASPSVPTSDTELLGWETEVHEQFTHFEKTFMG